jgi:hypothetical protein
MRAIRVCGSVCYPGPLRSTTYCGNSGEAQKGCQVATALFLIFLFARVSARQFKNLTFALTKMTLNGSNVRHFPINTFENQKRL